MAEEEKHIPGADNSEPEAPAPEAEKPEDDQAPEGDAPEGDEPKPEEEKPAEAEKPEEEAKPDPEPKLPKKRSIYDDLKDERAKRKEAEDEVARLKNEKPPEKPAEKPAEPAKPEKPADELEAYAQDNNLDAGELNRLVDILAKKLPAAQLSDEDKQALGDLKKWRGEQARSAEDNEVLATAPTVQKELGITDAGELKTVMDEVVRLSHTPEFHDKEVDYIVYRNRDKLSKLVSPKKPSFEAGGDHGDAPAEEEPDFGATKGITPEMAGKQSGGTPKTLEVRRGNKVIS